MLDECLWSMLLDGPYMHAEGLGQPCPSLTLPQPFSSIPQLLGLEVITTDI